MRASIAAISAFILMGCQQVDGGNAAAESEPKGTTTESIIAMVTAGDAEVCASRLVQHTMFEGLFGESISDDLIRLAQKGGNLEVDVVSMTEFKKDIKEVTCKGKLPGTEHMVQYKVRPSATGDNWVVDYETAQYDLFTAAGFFKEFKKQLEAVGLKPKFESNVEPATQVTPDDTLTTENVVANDVTAIDPFASDEAVDETVEAAERAIEAAGTALTEDDPFADE